MKVKYWLIICLACFILGGGSWALIDWKFFPCPVPDKTEVTQDEPQKPQPKPGVPNPYLCGKSIYFKSAMKDNNTLSVVAWNDCMTVPQDFTISYICPMPKWTLGIGIIGGAGYSPELKKFDALVGGELELFRHYKKLSVGGGAWYMQSLTSQYKAGGLKATLLFSFGRQ